MKGKTKVVVATLATVPFMMVLGNSMLIPVLPQMQKALDVTKFQTGLMVTAFSIPAAIAILAAGTLSDRLGRKVVIITSLILYGLGGLLAGLAAVVLDKPFNFILAARVLQGIGAAGTAPVAMAFASDIFTSGERSKVMGILEASNGFGKVISPIAGAALGLITWIAPFFTYGALALVFALGVAFFTHEGQGQGQGQSAKPKAKPFKDTMCDVWKECKPKLGTLLTAFLAGSVVLFNLFGILFYLSDLFEKKYGLDGVVKGLALAGPVLCMCITSYTIGVFLQKRRKLLKIFITTGMFVVAASTGLTAIIDNTIFTYIAICFIGIGNGLVLPGLNLLVTSSVNKESRGMVTALYGSVRFLGVALGPPAFGLAEKLGKTPMFLGAAALAAISAVLALFFLKPSQAISKGGGSGQGAKQNENKNDTNANTQGFQPENETSDDNDERVALYLGADLF